jgi:hypothetical protein
MKLYACDKCPIGAYAARKPDSIIARLWRWHTKWCPGWKAYQKSIAAEQQRQPESANRR